MPLTIPITVMAYETDFGAVVSNTRYLEYLERGRYALVHAAGFTVEQAWKEHEVQPVVRRVEVEYVSFARHEDQLELEITAESHAGATSILRFELRRQSTGEVVMRARQTLAYLNTKWRPVRVPAIYRDALPIGPLSTD